MKLIHLSDLHLGKIVNGFSMLEDQRYILTKIINVIDDEKPDAVLIAGDVYDRSVPSAEAVTLFDDFLNRLASRNLETFVISGNHDSAERISFASRLIDKSGVHFSPIFRGEITPYTLTDDFGSVNFYMLPFVKPAVVAEIYPDEKEKIKTYTDAVRVIFNHLDLDLTMRNVLITHQFVTGATRSDSEEKSLGGADNVDTEVFYDFDYVALGHIHRPQNIVQNKIRYSGSPLKYSFSEMDYEKSVTIIELGKKNEVMVRTAPLTPEKDLQELRGSFDELVSRDFYEKLKTDDYFRIVLTDEDDILNAMDKLRVIYPNIMLLEYDNSRTRNNANVLKDVNIDELSPFELFAEFYEKQNGRPLDEAPKNYLKKLINEIWEEK